ncbi:MAG: molybdopterin-synthase adenylyltransferase MoeB [Crocinitomicaceae bacterium]|nr:molybdopterin-synthase adenylyltransferase MoeB [Crocinitomicaceae bacterium]
MATIIIPTPLRKFTDNKSKIDTNGASVKESIAQLGELHPDLSKHLFKEDGELQTFLKIYVGETDIKALENGDTEVNESDIISIIPAIAGGTEDAVQFSKEELERYSRHLIIPEFNIEGQRKLKAARVLVIGTGGLGAPLLQYLAAAGIGKIGIVDYDVVEDSNLQRQVLFTQKDIGRPKVDAAKERIQSQNPHIEVVTYNTLFTSENALDIAKDYDVIADGTDNFPTRYLVNDVAVKLKIPNVYASIFRFEGQLTVFNYLDGKGELGPNYRDLFPTPPPPGLVPSCAEGGVIGVLPGILGSLQANEVIKVITGIGDILSGRLFLFDALSFETRTLKITKDKANPLTGENPTLTELIDYEHFCGLNVDKSEKRENIKEIDAPTLKDWLENNDVQLIDVREPFEYEIVNLDAQLIPQAEVLEHVNEISTDVNVVIHCRSGKRSADVIELLQDKYGFKNLYNLEGGILDWVDKVDQTLPKY